MKYLIFIILFIVSLNSFKGQTTAIPDPNFEQALINLGLDNAPINGSVPTNNIDTLTSLNVGFKSINSLSGIEDFTSLIYLNVESNYLSNLNISQNIHLTHLDCNSNLLNSLNTSQNSSLKILFARTNQFTSINLSQNLLLKNVNLSSSNLTSIDVTNNTLLDTLELFGNQLLSIDVSKNIHLKFLQLSFNKLTNIDVSKNTSLISLAIGHNKISSLEITKNSLLTGLTCGDNYDLTCLNVKNGNNINFVNFYALHTGLSCIEVDDSLYAYNNWSSFKDPFPYFSTHCTSQCQVGVNDFFTNSFKISPNPTSGNFTLKLEKQDKANITIYNIAGKIIFNKQYAPNEVIEINLDAPSSLYFVKVETDKGIFTKKIIKQ